MKMTVTYIIYLFLCAFVSVVCVKLNLGLKDWQYWAILGSVIGAYLCGTSTN